MLVGLQHSLGGAQPQRLKWVASIRLVGVEEVRTAKLLIRPEGRLRELLLHVRSNQQRFVCMDDHYVFCERTSQILLFILSVQ